MLSTVVCNVQKKRFTRREKLKREASDIMTTRKSENITWHSGRIDREARETLLNQRGIVLWYTGLSGSGKSTLANAVEERLYHKGCLTYILDGDNVRYRLNRNLGFSPEDREENIRRIGEVASLFCDAGCSGGSSSDLEQAGRLFSLLGEEILGFQFEQENQSSNAEEELMQFLIGLRKSYRENKQWELADAIRNGLEEIGIQLEDGKEGTVWRKNP